MLVLDSLEDPQNVGTLLRSAEAAGVHGVIFPTHRQAPLTPAAVKASAGAVEHLLLCPVDDLPGALADLHARGLRVAGAEADAPLTVRQTDLRGPLAIVVGSEGQGLGPAVRRRCDLFMRIPMRGAIGSLNAAVAGSVLLFEARRPAGSGRALDAACPVRRSSGARARRAGHDRCRTSRRGDRSRVRRRDAGRAIVHGHGEGPEAVEGDEGRQDAEAGEGEAGEGRQGRHSRGRGRHRGQRVEAREDAEDAEAVKGGQAR